MVTSARRLATGRGKCAWIISLRPRSGLFPDFFPACAVTFVSLNPNRIRVRPHSVVPVSPSAPLPLP